MKKLLVSLLTLVLVLSCVFAVSVSAEDIIDGNYYTAVCGEGSNWTWDAEALTLTYTNAEADSWTFTFTLKGTDLTMTAFVDNNAETLDDIIIPSYVKVDDATTYNVSVIAGTRGVTTIKSVVIYDGPTKINGSTFENCTGLESIIIPASVTSIGDYCFKQDTALHTVVINANVTSLGRDMFYKCTALKNVTLPDTLVTLGRGVFSACSALDQIEIPASVKTIGNTCFSGTGFKTITIPATVTQLDTSVFSSCLQLEEAYINSEGLTTIPDYTFQKCSALTKVVFPDTVTTIGKQAFQNTKISELDMKGVTALGDSAFSGAPLTAIDLTKVTTIGNNCFQSTALTTVTVPAGATLGTSVFWRCSKLQSAYILCEGLTKLPDGTFNECSKLKTLEYPDTVTEFGKSTFHKCGLDEVDLTGITKVGDSCFQWYTPASKGFVIPETLTDIGKLAFMSNGINYMIFEGKTAPTFGGEAGNPYGNGQGLRSDAKITGKVYVPANSTGYEQAFADFFTPTKMTLEYFGVKINSVEASETGYTVGYSYNDVANIKDNSNVDYQNDKLMVALYNADGALVAVKTVSATETTTDIETEAVVSYAKIFALDSLTTLTPVYESYQYTL